MSLATIENAVRDGIEHVVTDISQKVTALRPHLEELASLAELAESSPLVKAALSVALGPELELQLANIILTFAKAVGTAPVSVTPSAPVNPPAAPVG